MVRAQESKKQSRVSTYVKKILSDNDKRNEENGRTFNPITGEGSIGKRKKVVIKDHPLPAQYLPVGMLEVPLVKLIVKHKSMKVFCEKELDAEYTEENRLKIIEQIVRIRIQYDFAFWAALLVHIKKKGGDDDILFRLTRPQRKFVEKLEELRLANKPIRIILLKARQWGGSTTSQLYMAWLQLVHKKGLNSLIVAHQGSGSDEIKDMFDRMIKAYPIKMLHELGEIYNPNEVFGLLQKGRVLKIW